MAFFPITISQTQNMICPEPELATFANQDCTGFDADWTVTVESAVTQGKHLQDCKPLTPEQNECQVGIDYVKPCMEKKRSHRKCYQRPCYAVYNSPCLPNPCGCCPQTSVWSRSQSCKRSQTKLPHHKQCPVRVMELAAPTKRHCLDTWRSKSHILPDIMMERVRQYVMDEKPLVQIPDALHCFKRRVSNRSSRNRNCKTEITDACMTDMKQFSALFAYCVAHKLDKPLNISLNPQLEKISKIVSYEISMVTNKNNKNTNVKNNKKRKFEEQMQDEMSKKVTAWIDNVLVDTSDKLLEDDLRELEEIEGPVLDIIDDFIEKVLDLCEPLEDTAEDIIRDEATTDIKSEKSATIPDEITTLENTPMMDGEKDGDVDGNGLRTDNDLPIENITSELNEQTDIIKNDMSIENSTGELNKQTEITKNDMSIENITGELNEETDVIKNLDTTAEYTDMPIEHILIPSADGFDAQKEDLDIETDDLTGEIDKVSEPFKKYSEESLDEKNITVTFSNIDMVGGGIEDSHLENLHETDYKMSSPSQQNITFAPPNEHLLSSADESWPTEMPKITEKPSATAMKSITTLGYLDETEEIETLDPDGGINNLRSHGMDKPNGDMIDDVVNKLQDIETKEAKPKFRGAAAKAPRGDADARSADLTKITKLGHTDKNKEMKTMDRDGDINNLLNLQTSPNIDKRDGDAADNAQKIDTKEVPVHEANISNVILGCEVGHGAPFDPTKIYRRPDGKIDYKVDARTAPPWVLTGRCDKGGGEPEGLTYSEHRNKDENELEMQRELRIWNQNLEIVCTNLQMWHDWIEITCKNISNIKRKSERNRSSRTCTCRQKDIHCWMKLKRYIIKDSQVWFKFQRSAKRKLKTYKYTYRYKTKRPHNRTDSAKYSLKMDLTKHDI